MKSSHATATLVPASEEAGLIAEIVTEPTTPALRCPNSHAEAQTPAQDDVALEIAVDRFIFPACFLWFEVTNLLSLSGRLKLQFLGKEMACFEKSLIKRNTPLCWLRCKEVSAITKPLLIAPVDAEVVHCEVVDNFYYFRLRPTEKQRLRDYFSQALALGITLKEAGQQLSRRLEKASHIPITAMQKQRQELS